jgi:hypothetical protein
MGEEAREDAVDLVDRAARWEVARGLRGGFRRAAAAGERECDQPERREPQQHV